MRPQSTHPVRLWVLEPRLTPALVGPGILDQSWAAIDALPPAQPGQVAHTQPQRFTPFTLSHETLARRLAAAPHETAVAGIADGLVLGLPRPDGRTERVRVWESTVMEPGLASNWVSIRTFRGQGLDDPSLTVAMDLSEHGFHGFVSDPSGGWAVAPYYHLDTSVYASYFHADVPDHGSGCDCELCSGAVAASGFGGGGGGANGGPGGGPLYTLGATRRTFRLAMAATAEYTSFHGGVAGAQAQITSLVNRLNAMFERDLALRFTLVANNSKLVFTDASKDPYTNGNLGAMLGENQTTCDNVVGAVNYEMGHVLGTNAGGLASLGVAGIDGSEARAASADGTPSVNNQYFVTRVAHEMAHNLNAGHTFNSPNFGGAYSAASAWERGQGSTILSYALAGSDTVSATRDEYFNSSSIEQMLNYITGKIPTVGTLTTTNNKLPVVNAGLDYTVPARTPLALTGTATDGDGDALTFTWEQFDLGPAQLATDPDNGKSPLFRSFAPSADPVRTLPRLPDLLAGKTTPGELLPTTNRSLNFRFTARDNRALGGAVVTDDAKLTVVDTGSAFRVTSQATATSWKGGSEQTITWKVAGTTGGGINAANVEIRLSTDGGLTYPTVLLASTPNDGSQAITVPNVDAGSARVKVSGVNNIFFNINEAAITITKVVPPAPSSITGVSYDDADGNGSQGTGEAGVAGRVVFIDSNNNGRFDFGGTPIVYAAPMLPVPINDLTTVRVPLTISGVSGTIADVDVALDITHTWNADLDVFLIHPNGKRVELFTDIGGASDNFTGTIFDDEAQVSITSGTGPFTGRFRPEGKLSDLDGLPISGTWYLEITDDAAFDIGTLNSWSLTIGRNFTNSIAVAIPDLTTVTSTITPPFLAGVVSDIDVTINITHTFTADLDIFLIGPNGVRVELTTDNGGSGDNYTNTTFDDDAAVSIVDGTAPFTGRFRPEGKLSAFNGISPNGNWTLEITDDANLDTGSLLNWTLTIGRTFSQDVAPVAISDNQTVTQSFPITGTKGPILDLDVSLNINHTWNADLDVFLISPAGTRVELFTDVGGSSDNFTNTILDDQAAVPITAGTGPFTGRYRPEESLAKFNGESANGTWTLEITDDASGDSGQLIDWSLTLRTAETFAGTGGVAIPDLKTVTSPLAVSGATGLINDLDVTLDITHTWTGDLNIFLIGPGGQRVELSTGNGGGGDNYTNTTFDDEAAVSITAATAPFTGRFRPEGKLSDFDGLDPNGTWTLEITDSASGDSGTLNSWSITFSTGERYAVTDAAGAYTLPGLLNGSYTVREVLPPGFRRTQPTTDNYSVNITGPGLTISGKDFGAQADLIEPTAKIQPISPNPRNTAVGAIEIVFSEPVIGFDRNDLKLLRDGKPVPFDTEVTLASDDNVIWSLNGLNDLTNIEGTYELSLSGLGSGVIDLAGNPFTQFRSESWLADFTAPTVTAVTLLDPSPTNAPTVRYGLTFSEPVVGLTAANLVLDKYGTLSGQSISKIDGAGASYTVTVNSGVGAGGLYLDVANSTGLSDPAGNAVIELPYFSPTPYVIDREAPVVTAFVVDDGTGQRSRVRKVTVTFSEPVTYPSGAKAAFGYTGPANTSFDVVAAGQTATITFTGTGLEAGSLPDGNFTITVLPAFVTDSIGNSLTAGPPLTSHRLFGDINGDRSVNFTDFLQFRSAFGSTGPASPYANAFDFDNDNTINFTDFLQFRTRFGTTLNP